MTLPALRRRWWLLVLCTLAVAGIAYGVGVLRSQTSTAEAVVIVNAGVITMGPGEEDDAYLLAGNYLRLVPQDDSILTEAGRQLGVPVRGRIRISRADRRSALLHLRFSASDGEAAVTGARVLARVLSGGNPVSPSILPDSISVVRLPTRATRDRRGFAAETVLLVSGGGGQKGPGYGDQAIKLAPSYAASIPDDARVLAYVSDRLGRPIDEVEENVTVTRDKETAVLRLRYKSDSKAEAEKGAAALGRAVSGPSPVSPSITPRTLSLVRVREAETPSSDAAVTLPVGALLGLCLGVVLLMALERADPRIDDPDMLSEELHCPAFRVGEVTPSLATTLFERWRVLGGGDRPTVALTAASRELEPATAQLADQLVIQGTGSQNGPSPLSGGLKIVLGPAPSENVSGAGVAARSDVTVLVVSEGDRLANLRSTRKVLDDFEAPAQWALLLTRGTHRSLNGAGSSREGGAQLEREDVYFLR